MHRLKWLLPLALFVPLLMAPSGGYPSFPTFQGLTITTPTGTLTSTWNALTSGQSANLVLENNGGTNALGFCISDTAAVCTTGTLAHDPAQFFTGLLHFTNSNGSVEYGKIGAGGNIMRTAEAATGGVGSCSFPGLNVGFTGSCTRSGAGVYVLTFSPVWTSATSYACTAMSNNNTLNINFTVVSGSASSVTIGTGLAAVATDETFNIVCQGT